MTIRLLGASILVVAATISLHAQRVHRGFWIGFAPGGVATAGAGGTGYPVHYRLGGTISQRVLVGVETFAIFEVDPEVTSGNLTIVALVYPSSTDGLFAKAGLGYARANALCPSSPNESADGIGATLGLGYDVRLGNNLYLTPNIDVLLRTNARPLCSSGTPPLPGQTDPGLVRDYGQRFAFTLGLTWH